MNTSMRSGCVVMGIAFLAGSALQHAFAQKSLSELDTDERARVQRLADSPMRWIIMADNLKVKKLPDEPVQPVAKPKVTGVAKPKAGTENTSTSAIKPALASTKPGQSAVEQVQGNTVFTLFDASNSRLMVDGSVADSSGAFFEPRAFTYSDSKPNPVKAKFSYDPQNHLISLDYSVPESVGYFGGAGVTAFAPGDGKNLSELVKNSVAGGLLVLRIGAKVETRVKVSVIGPKERMDMSYPFFILPVKAGVNTYGLALEDFRQPPWSATAPTIESSLKNVVGVSVEYSRGNANGIAETGILQIGDIRFDAPSSKAAKAQ